MARFNIADAEKYGGQGGGGYFSLKNNGDSARIRIMYNRYEDIEGYAVHEVSINGKKRYVDCLRTYDDPKDMCPLCRSGSFAQVKVFIPVYCVDEDRVKVWERGKTYISRLKMLFEENAEGKPLISTVFKVQKNVDDAGKCSFDITPEYTGSVEMDDFPEEPQPVYGGLVLQKTAEEMERYLTTGYFG